MTTRSPKPAAEIAAINARHLVETPLRPAGLLFVFGTQGGRRRAGPSRPAGCGRKGFPLGGRERRGDAGLRICRSARSLPAQWPRAAFLPASS